MRVEVFRPFHLELMRAQGVQSAQARELSHVPPDCESVKPAGVALTAFAGDRVILCGGVIPMRPQVGTLWALVSADAGLHMLWLHRATKRVLTLQHWERIEATVEEGFPEGCRWLTLLGFKSEGPMPKYGLNGETHIRFGRT